MTTRPEGVVAAFQGMATVATAESFQDEVNKLAGSKAKLVILELSALQFMSSFAIGSFLKLASDVQMKGGQLRIAAPSEYISSLLQATRVDQKLKVYPSVESAIAG
ncbi:MAG: STAS domain-containing protein [Phycisphaerales bacterium]